MLQLRNTLHVLVNVIHAQTEPVCIKTVKASQNSVHTEQRNMPRTKMAEKEEIFDHDRHLVSH